MELAKVEEQKPKTGSLTAGDAFAILLESVGSFGKWQWKLMFITMFCGFFGGLHNFSGALLGAIPEHWCKIPGIEANASYTKQLQNETTPLVRGRDGYMEPSSCSYYSDFQLENPSIVLTCDEWFYDDSIYSSTVTTEWDLVCNDRWLVSAAQSIYMVGVLVGAVVLSVLSDRWGRKNTCILSSAIFFVSSTVASFSTSYGMFLALRFVVAAAQEGIYLAGFVLLMECVGTKGRTVLGILFQTGFTLGFIILAPAGYVLRDWRFLHLFISVPSIALLIFIWIIPESPRWLLSQNRRTEAMKVMEDIAKYNGKKLPDKQRVDELIEIIQKEADEPAENKTIIQRLRVSCEGIISLVRTPNMRRRNLIIFYAWFATAMMYYGLTFNSANLNVSVYLNVFLSGLFELPALAITIFSLFWLGRRRTLFFAMGISGVSSLTIVFIPKSLYALNLSLSTIGKCMCSCSFFMVFLYAAELVPTNVRNISVGIASLCARFGAGASPFIVDLLGRVYYAIPSTIFGVVAIIAALLVLLLPETGDQKLPESIQEVEEMER